MTPLRAAVIEKSDSELMIRTKQGVRLRVPAQKGLGLGDTCYILYDFTRMNVREVWTEEDLLEPQSGPEPENFLPEDESDLDTLPPEILWDEGCFS